MFEQIPSTKLSYLCLISLATKDEISFLMLLITEFVYIWIPVKNVRDIFPWKSEWLGNFLPELWPSKILQWKLWRKSFLHNKRTEWMPRILKKELRHIWAFSDGHVWWWDQNKGHQIKRLAKTNLLSKSPVALWWRFWVNEVKREELCPDFRR